MDASGIDEETLRLIIDLQLKDVEDINSPSKDKHRIGEPPDSLVATNIYESELKRAKETATDAVMCRSMATAVRDDGDTILALELHEQQARDDRYAAQCVQDEHTGESTVQQDRSRANSIQSTLPHVDNELFEKMLTLNVRDEPGETSQWAASRQSKTRQCDTCTEYFGESLLIELTCTHSYCKDCIVRLYTDC